MTDSKEVRMQPLGPPGCLGHGHTFVLQLLGLTLFAGLLVALLVQVSKVPSSQEQEQELAKQEKVYQELTQLKAGVNRLCRPCPWDWTFFQGHCYFFSKSQRNWHDSVTACQEVGAQLVIINSDEEQSFLQLTTKKRGHTWMGLSDLNKEATWHWVDGSPLSLRFMKYWNPTEPNNLGQEDCAEFDGDGWNDAKCDISKFWVCKKSALSCSHE
ncbi:CD209 antigen-like protein C [Ictidomys tridecemlineatus]